MKTRMTLRPNDPRAALLGRIGAARRWQRTVTVEARREATAKARQAQAALRVEAAKARALELGFEELSPADLQRLSDALEAERQARLTLAASDAARRRRAKAAQSPTLVVLHEQSPTLRSLGEEDVS